MLPLRLARYVFASIALSALAHAQVLPGYPVENLGGGLAGSNGVPQMSVSGMLAPGETVVLTIDNAAPNAIATLVVGSTIANIPAFGGIVIPNPEILLPAITDSAGHAEISLVWSEALMSTTFWQWGAVDAGAVEGWSLSNALAIVLRPWNLKKSDGTIAGTASYGTASATTSMGGVSESWGYVSGDRINNSTWEKTNGDKMECIKINGVWQVTITRASGGSSSFTLD